LSSQPLGTRREREPTRCNISLQNCREGEQNANTGLIAVKGAAMSKKNVRDSGSGKYISEKEAKTKDPRSIEREARKPPTKK
jgi:hypothetical protein